MIINRTKRALTNTFIGLICKLITSFAPFALRITIINKLGIEYLGLSGLFTSLLTMLSLSELGFSSAVVYSLYKPIAENDNEMVCALMTFYKKVYRIVGVAILVLGILLLPYLKFFVKADNVTFINIKIVFLIYLLNCSISYLLFAYKNAILIASMRSDIENLINTLCTVFLYIFQIILLYIYSNYYVFVALIPIFTIFNNVIRLIVVKKLYPSYDKSVLLEPDVKSDIINRVLSVFGHRVAGVVFSSADTIVISTYLGLAILGKYSNYLYIYTAVYSIIAIVFNSSLAVVGNSLVCRTVEENKKTFDELFFLNAWLTGFCSCCFIVLYQPFIKIWLGNEVLLPDLIPLLQAMFFYVQNIRRVCHAYKDAAGMWQEDFWKPIISAIFNIITNILLVKYIGLAGVLISSILAIVLIEMPWETEVLYNKYFKINSDKYFISLFQYTITTVLIILLVVYLNNIKLLSNNYLELLVKLVFCVLIYNVCFILIYYRSAEFKMALKRFKI